MTEKQLFEMVLQEQKKLQKIYRRERLYAIILLTVTLITLIIFYLIIKFW